MNVLTFGEILLRLKSEGYNRLFQTQNLEATFGGGEANVSVSLCNFGIKSEFFTALPDNAVGDAAIRELRKYGVGTDKIIRRDGRMGLYFLEAGACQRSSNVIYDREYTAISLLQSNEIDWDKLFSGVDWFHISGITPALSDKASIVTIDAVREAHNRGIKVSCDLNYRSKLWKYGKKPSEVMCEVVKYCDVLIAGREDIQKNLEIYPDGEADEISEEVFSSFSSKVMKAYPNLNRIAITLRESISCDDNSWGACLYNGSEFFMSTRYEIKDIVDRVGGGDAFSGGLLYGLLSMDDDKKALEFAVAASCLKHSIPGDVNLVTVKEVENLMSGNGSGRVQR